MQANTFNASSGDLQGYNCEHCHNKGYVAVVEDDVMKIAVCRCQKLRRCIRLFNQSGINPEYDLKNYKAMEPWQKDLLETAYRFLENPTSWVYMGGQVGCVDKDTEYFDGYGWRKISEYDLGRVLQYNPLTKKATLVFPHNYIAEPAGKMYYLRNKTGSINQVLSDDHNFAYITSKGHMRKKTFKEVMEMHNKNTQGFYGRIETAFSFEGPGVALTENEIRIMCAVIADGYFRKNVRFCDIQVKKTRKIERMRFLLSGIEHKEYQRKGGYVCFRFHAPRKEKEFTDYWYNCNKQQLKIITDEIFFWDGHVDNVGRKSFCTTSKRSADFIQFAISATGHRSTIYVDDRKETVAYVVNKVKNSSTVSLASTGGKNKTDIENYTPIDGMQYCFTVPTGYLILRRENRIFITGNCGKSHVCTGIVRELLRRGIPARYMLWRDEAVKLKACVNDTEEYMALIEPLKNIEVLYIDDFFKAGSVPTNADVNLAFEIINARYNKKLVTLISSEYFIDELSNQVDEAVGSRIFERARGFIKNIGRVPERNYRLKDISRI